MAATVRGAIRELLEQTMTTMDALLEASDRELPMPSSHVCAQGKDVWYSHRERHRSREDPYRADPRSPPRLADHRFANAAPGGGVARRAGTAGRLTPRPDRRAIPQ